MSRKLDVVTLDGEEYDALIEKVRLYEEALKQEPVGKVSDHFGDTGLLYSGMEPGQLLYAKPVPRVTAASDMMISRDRIMQMICEAEEANPDDERSVCVDYDALYVDITEILSNTVTK